MDGNSPPPDNPIKSIPAGSTTDDIISLGIDEAGRGPVLGPMVYACFYCRKSLWPQLVEMGVTDSKKLTTSDRERIANELLQPHNKERFGWVTTSLSAVTISGSMLAKRHSQASLNDLSYNAAIGLIRTVLDSGVNLREAYVDTVGRPEPYQRRLQSLFPTVVMTVAEKADDIYPVVGAASIFAKVSRDRQISGYIFPEPSMAGVDPATMGSGYPGDPLAKSFLVKHFDRLMGFPSVVRSSWSTARSIIDEKGYKVEWYEADQEDITEEAQGLPQLKQPARRLNHYFESSTAAKKTITTPPSWKRRGLARVISVEELLT